MDLSVKKSIREENLNDSWVDVRQSGTATPASGNHSACGISNEAMEKLLLEAQRESLRSSAATSCQESSTSSPPCPGSPQSPPTETTGATSIQGVNVLPALQGTDWIWDWSSRPDVAPPSDFASRFKHPAKRPALSVRNTGIMKKQGLFCMENLPSLILTHACTFFMGAAVMFVYLKKYCSWAVVTTQSLD